MKRTQIVTGVAAAVGMLLLILDSKTALSGAADGLNLCILTVIPSLFPFFILSILLTGSLLGASIPVLRPLGKCLGLPLGAEALAAAGFLGGYPVGAQSISDACRRGKLSRSDAARMLAFCNNAGPAFIFGMASALFPYAWMPWALWGIHIFSAALVAMLLPGKSLSALPTGDHRCPTVSEALLRSLKVMAQVCGWVILFRVVLAYMDRWLFFLVPETMQIILTGILELANGCCTLVAVENLGLRFVLCSVFLAFGGLCVALQTISVAEGMDLHLYFPGKILQTLFSLCLSLLLQRPLPDEQEFNIPIISLVCLLLITIFPFILVKSRNKSGNLSIRGV